MAKQKLDSSETAKQRLDFIVNPEDELLPSEISAVEAQVERELDAEIKAKAKEKLKEKLLKRARQKRGVEEAMIEIMIDLAPYADRVTLDGVSYMNGQTYTVRASVAAVMAEQMQRTWIHQSEIDGKSENFYRRTRDTRIGPQGVVNGSFLLRA